MFSIRVFANENGKEPFTEWVNAFSTKTRNRIYDRINRVERGNFGDHKHIEGNIFELRFFFDGGLRVYFGKDEEKIILLLCGGDKSNQKRDIEKAKEYWRQYHEQKES